VSWESFAEFAAMGGYGAFVWGSYGVAALCLGAEIALVLRRIKRIRGALGRLRE
jgi:heme exporter protein D